MHCKDEDNTRSNKRSCNSLTLTRRPKWKSVVFNSRARYPQLTWIWNLSIEHQWYSVKHSEFSISCKVNHWRITNLIAIPNWFDSNDHTMKLKENQLIYQQADEWLLPTGIKKASLIYTIRCWYMCITRL